MKKTVLFGGTFNPVHNGHVALLKALKQLPNVEKILILPANIPPHKAAATVSGEHRLAMCKLAFEGLEQVTVSDLELTMGGKSYTLHTLLELQKRGVQQPYLAIGGDSLRDFEKWYEYRRVLQLCHLAVCPRAGVQSEDFLKELQRLQEQGAFVTVLPVQLPEVSSTQIRERALAGQSLAGLVPEKVEEYILKNRLYCPVKAGKE